MTIPVLTLTLFYTSYAIILVQFVLSWKSDRSALVNQEKRDLHDYMPNGISEKTPLIRKEKPETVQVSSSKDKRTHLSYKGV